jgi:hypothetical protein
VAAPWSAVRGFGVVLGGPVVLLAGAAGSVVAAARALVRGRAPAPAAAAGVALTAAYALVARPWMRRWGATAAERPGPGDGPVHAVTVDAPAGAVWPWLAQIGQDRGGFYSYEWLENLAGCRMRNADRVHPEWQHREVGETIPLHPATGLPCSRFEPGRALGVEGWGTFVLTPVDGGRRTRLVVRSPGAAGAGRRLVGLLVELPHFVMERRMLLGIKERAEATTA